jgi:nicotinamide riboside kinase
MKIVVLGSHGTGKTTLTRQLHNYLQDKYKTRVKKVDALGCNIEKAKNLTKSIHGLELPWKYLPEAPVEAFRKGFTMNEDTSLESEWWIIAKQIEMEMLTPIPWIADKCLIDILVYAYFLFKEEKDFLAVAEKMIKKNIDYDLVIYLPVGEFPIEDDGLRSLDPKFQKDIDELLLKVMGEMNIPYHVVSGKRDERTAKARKIIDDIF